MNRAQLFGLALGATLVLSFVPASSAQPHVSFGIRLGGPVYYGRPWHGYHYTPYYYAPAPYVYEPAPIVVRQAPYVIEYAPTTVLAPPPYVSRTPEPPVAPTIVKVGNDVSTSPSKEDALLSQLSHSNETVRRDAAMDLGRMKSQRALDALATLLAKDASPAVRDASARALGLIASQRSLNALIYAAQADADRDVRHSAQFAVEIIRTNLRQQ